MTFFRIFAALAPLFAAKLQPGCKSELDLGSTYKTPVGSSKSTPQSACLNTELFGGSETSWILQIKSSRSIDFGVSHLDLIGEGWNSTGLFYNGNLHDGRGVIKGNFGPHLKAGDTIEMFVQMKESDDNSRLRIAYKLNNMKLGTAFDLTPIPIQPLHVCIRLQGDTSEVVLEENNDVKGLEDFEPRDKTSHTFKLDNSSSFLKEIGLIFPSGVVVQMEQKSTSLEFMATKGNKMSVDFQNDSEPYKLSSNVRSTRMLPPLKEVNIWENQLLACLGEEPTLVINEEVATINCSSGNLIFNSETKAFDAVTMVERFLARIPKLE
eukprot:GHVP01035798.1.p1 GENE.GHVP01035798.1~~GHVP01035798.1.p1  ORF type:complete len:323 (-),score=73.53 GHVP01035798.1:664-1632(-)